MKKLVIGLSVLLVLLFIGLIALPSLVPSVVYKEKIETQLSKELERDVRVIGDIKLSVFPVIQANAGRVEIDNPEGFKDAQFASMDGMSARVKLMPLFSKRVEITAFILKTPVINLEKNASGNVNWAFGDSEPKPVKTEDEGPFKRDGRYSAVDPSIGKFSLENGTIKYSDAVKGETYDLNAVNVDFSLASLSAPLDIDGDFVYKNISTDLNLKLDSIRAFLDGKEAPLSLSLKTEFADISGKGKILAGEDIGFNVDLDADISDVARLVRFSPVEVPYADLANEIKVSGNYNLDGKVLTANNADISLAGSNFDAGFKGGATLAQPPVFDGRVSLDARDVQSLAKALKQDVKGLELIQTAKFEADLKALDKGFAANNIDANLQGDGLAATYTGSANIADAITATGSFSGDVTSLPSLLKSLEMDIPQAALVESLNAKGSVNYSEDLISLSSLDVKTSGGTVTGSYNGGATITKGDPALNGQFSVDVPSVAQANKVADLKIDAANMIGNLNATGRINLNGKNISVSELVANTQGDIVSGQYTGDVKMTDGTPALTGQFTVDIPSVAEANRVADLKIDAANLVGNLNATGRVNLAGKNISISNLAAKTQGDIINGQYNGSAKLGEVTGYDGNFTTTITSLNEISNRSNIKVPYANTIGVVNVKGNISGQGEAIRFSSLDASLTDGQINGTFTGAASMNNGFNLDGDLSADIPSLRTLAQATGSNALPPSTSAGPIYERFAVSGKVKGNPAEITFTSAQVALDALQGTGDFEIDLKKAKPEMNATMNMNGLDVRPYMAAYSTQKPKGTIQPWSEAPINTAPLKAFNGRFTFNTPNVVTSRMSLGQTTINAALRDGRMVADLPNLLLYGGAGRMNVVLNGSSSVPSVSLDMSMKKVNSDSLFNAAAGFSNASGEIGSAFKIQGSGRSQAAIMKSLKGGGDFRMLNGLIRGVDLEALLNGLDQALASRALPAGVGPTQVTRFSDLSGLFTITNGVANVNKFSLGGAGVLAEGGGSIDLGNQYIDFSLRPRLTGKNANDLAAFGIPIQAKGNFGNVKVGLDTNILGDIIAERARAKAASLITDQIGGSAGGILGSVIGGSSSGTQSGNVGSLLGGVVGGSSPRTQTPGTPTSGTPTSGTQSGTPRNTEEVVGGLLGGLLGGQQTPAPTQSGTPAQETGKAAPKEPSVEDALIGIFGKKKKKKSDK